MQAVLTTLDFEKLLGRIQAMPWRPIAIVASISFVGATLLSSVISVIMMPQSNVEVANLNGDQVVSDDSALSKLPLTDADLKVIYDRNIFNRDGQLGDADPDAAGEAGAEAQKSDLPLRVTGIIYGGTPYSGLVTIENTQNTKTNSFVVGDTLVREAVLSEIHRTRIFIERGKRREYLDLETPELVRSQRQKKATPSASSGGSAPIATGPALAKFKEEGFERDGGEMLMSQEYKQRMILGDLTKVLQDAKAVPNMVDNQIRGFRLERIRENSIYQKAGFQNGDVVEEINGVLLNDPGSAIKQLRMVQNESEIEVTVNRNGSPMTMKLKVQ